MARTGRPLKFKTVEEFEQKVEEYFESLWEETWEKVGVKRKDAKTKKVETIFEWQPVLDRHGKQTFHMKEHPTITGLALALDTSRVTLMEYDKRDEFTNAVKKAKDRIEYYTEIAKENDAVKIFKLKNFGWKDQREIAHGGTDKPIKHSVEKFDLEERKQQIIEGAIEDVLQ